eukprot:Platyproteum_vivax@DN5985_c0_g1_i2.p1
MVKTHLDSEMRSLSVVNAADSSPPCEEPVAAITSLDLGEAGDSFSADIVAIHSEVENPLGNVEDISEETPAPPTDTGTTEPTADPAPEVENPLGNVEDISEETPAPPTDTGTTEPTADPAPEAGRLKLTCSEISDAVYYLVSLACMLEAEEFAQMFFWVQKDNVIVKYTEDSTFKSPFKKWLIKAFAGAAKITKESLGVLVADAHYLVHKWPEKLLDMPHDLDSAAKKRLLFAEYLKHIGFQSAQVRNMSRVLFQSIFETKSNKRPGGAVVQADKKRPKT